MGPPSPRTLRVQGRIRELPVKVLIDSESSHNIMQPRVANFLNLPIVALTPFSIIVGNGESIQCSGNCSDVPVTLAERLFHIPFYILPIHGADLVLGVQWLQTLGPILSDYSVPSIQFSYNNHPITLRGTSVQQTSPVSLAQFHCFVFTNSIESVHSITLSHIEDAPTNSSSQQTLPFNPTTLQPSIAELLLQFVTIFGKPQGLPPHRNLDHHIHLLPDSAPVNIKPYRYPQSQKELMTQMIKEMLEEGIIKPSTSPFSSLVLLVKKKYGTWRFCVDYRALNALTVKDRFPIPTVDELLDELHGSTVFSKLDLCSGYHQILLAPNDTFKTTFRTVDGHF